MLRQASLGEEDGESTLETFHQNPVGNYSHPVRASHPPEASLASSSAMAARSVDSECKSCVIEPRNKAKLREPSSSWNRGLRSIRDTTSTHCTGLVGAILPGSESRANAHQGSLGTWEIPSISAPNRRQGPSGRPSPRLVDGPLASTRAKPQSAGAVP